MTLFATPGIYRQTVEPAYRPGPLARGDIAVFLGYARRGPVGVPVRLQSLSQFEEVFGPRLPGGYLWDGVKGFFECGGAAAYALRIASGAAAAASADLGNGWRAGASFPWAMVDPGRTNRAGRADLAVWQARVDAEIREGGPRRDDPGGWGNGLELAVSPAGLVATAAWAEGADALRLDSMAGVEAASILRLTQAETGATAVAALAGVEPALRRVRLARPLAGFDPTRAIRVASVEFDLTVSDSGRILQSFRTLAPDPAHSRAIATVFAREARDLALTGPGAGTDFTQPAAWPPEGRFALAGGKDGLAGVGAAEWSAALDALLRLTDAAMIVAPDLVLDPGLPQATEATPGPARPCADISPTAPGFLSGVVRDGESGQAVSGCLVDVQGPGGWALTDAAGRFDLAGLDAGLVDLRLSHPAHEVAEITAQTSPFPGAEVLAVSLAPLARLPALAADAVLLIQQAMADPAVVGRWKIAFADPPAGLRGTDALLSRAAELGPEPRLAFHAPWIEVPDATAEGGCRPVPPSGHVAGAFARAELEGGIHRNGANLPLRYACGVTEAVDDALQAGLNPAGVNAIRAFPGRGIRAFGARSLAVGTEWRFLSARRIVDAIERTLEVSLANLVFEPNSAFLRQAARASTEAYLSRLWREGHLAGDKPEAAFRVTCDEGNNPAATVDGGQLLIEVAVAPVVPFEFIIFRIGHAFDAVQITEVA